ncbi:MAG: hypothetical protein WBD19_11715 [Candidatus Acidiferrum sp.]
MSFRAGGVPYSLELAVRANEKGTADDAKKRLAEEFFHAARAVCFDSFKFRIAEQIEVEFLLDLEDGLRFDGIAAGAEDNYSEFIEVMLCVTKLGRFGRSTGSVGFGIEKEDDALAGEVGERDVGTGVAFQAECGGFITYFEWWHDGILTYFSPASRLLPGELTREKSFKIFRDFRYVQFALVPRFVSRMKGGIVRLAIFSDALRHNLLAREQFALFQTDQVIAGGSSCPPIAFNKRVNPIQPPKGIARDPCGMIDNRPILMDHRKKSIHQVRNLLEVRRNMVPDINWILAESPSKLSNVGYCSVIQSPQCVFVEGFYALL